MRVRLGLWGAFVVMGVAAAGCSGSLECSPSGCVRPGTLNPPPPTQSLPDASPDATEDAEPPADGSPQPDAPAEPLPDGAVLPDAMLPPDAPVAPIDAPVDAMLPPDAPPAQTEAQICGDRTGAMGYRFDLLSRHCYILWPNPLTGPAARQACADRGGHLATISNVLENHYVEDLAEDANTRTWIGLVRTKTGVPMTWVTGEPLSYTDWANDEPGTDDQACGVFEPNGTDQGWHDFPCTSTYPYICEREPR